MALLIRERYEPLEPLGVGGEARVVKALDRQLGRFVALKIRWAPDGAVREELLREARILLAIPPHPALPLVREDFFDGDDYVLAMDWVDGTDLATLLRARGHPGLAPSSVLAYLAEAAEALAHLHAQEPPVVHGDVKPANLILTTGGRVKLVDFGLSSTPGERLRRAGTPGYRAPELATNADPSRASDIYGLAATAFALLTGSAPSGVLPAWDGVNPVHAQQFEAAIRHGLSTDPSRRPAAPGELVERLRAGWAQALPTGVVTFCVSDIPGSAAQWESSPGAMAVALVRHDELIAGAMARHGGRLITSMGQGDSTVSVFESAPAAVAAAVAAVRGLGEEQWSAGLPITPRFALHTGASDRRGTDYYGPSMSVAVRLRGQADTGEVLLSSVTAELVADHLPGGYSLVDLGPHAWERSPSPERVYALRGPGVQAPLAAGECPYRGLLAFEPEDRSYFFGREPVVAELVARLTTGRLLSVVGASGSGKSSVLRAGVIAAVRAGEIPGLERAQLVTPASDPALTSGGGDPGELLVVDQFEELFSDRGGAARRDTFIEALLARRGAVAIGVRADMYGRLAEHPALARAVAANQVLLGPMSDTELARAVIEPARLAGLRPEPGLVELAVREVAGEPGALPLLSHALRATWERRRGRSLTVENYRASGGVASALALTADALLHELLAADRQLVRSMFLRLTELHEDGAETRRRVRVVDLAPAGVAAARIAALLERLADARLVTLDQGTAEVAHEVLIRQWPTLRGWLEEDREGIRLHRHLGDTARAWDTGGREPSDLYRGSRLATAVDWASSHREEFNADERAFIDASIERADHERLSQRRTNHRLRALLTGAITLVIVAAIAGLIALHQRNDARAQALTSDAERVGAQALVEKNLDLSMLYAVLGVKLQNRLETRSDLLTTLQDSSTVIRVIHPSDDQITSLAIDPRRQLMASGDSAGVVRFEDMSSWNQRGSSLPLPGSIPQEAMTFSPRGDTLAVLSEGGAPVGEVQAGRTNLYAIDVATRRIRLLGSWRGVWSSVPYPGASLAYDPSGRYIALSLSTWAPDGSITADTLALLNASTGRPIWRRSYPLVAGQLEPRVAFAPDGALITSAQQGHTLLWNRRTGRVQRRFPIGGQPALSADGTTLALAMNSPDLGIGGARIAVLNLRSGRYRFLSAELPDTWLRGFAFTPDGTIVGATIHGDVDVWDVANGGIIETIPAPQGARASEALDQSGRTLLVGSQAGTVTVSDLSGSRRLGRAFQWNTPEQSCPGTPCIVVNRQSNLMATDQNDGSIALINLQTLRRTATLPARNGSVANGIAFFPDGRTLLTGGITGYLTLWDVRTDRVTRRIGLGEAVWGAAVSPNGRLLAAQTQSQNSTASRVEVRPVAGDTPLWSHEVQDGTGGLNFSPDGREVAALGCCTALSTVVSWGSRSGVQLFRRRLSEHATAIAYTPDSRLLVVGTENGEILFWNARSGAQERSLHVSTGNVAQISFSPDGTVMAVSSLDGSTTLWDLRSGQQLGSSFPERPNVITSPVFEPNGRLLLDYLADAAEWPIDVRAWERYACQVAGRNLTKAEWRAILPDRPYQHICPA